MNNISSQPLRGEPREALPEGAMTLQFSQLFFRLSFNEKCRDPIVSLLQNHFITSLALGHNSLLCFQINLKIFVLKAIIETLY